MIGQGENRFPRHPAHASLLMSAPRMGPSRTLYIHGSICRLLTVHDIRTTSMQSSEQDRSPLCPPVSFSEMPDDLQIEGVSGGEHEDFNDVRADQAVARAQHREKEAEKKLQQARVANLVIWVFHGLRA